MKSIKRRRSPLGLFLLILFWSVILGLGLAQAQVSSPGAGSPTAPETSEVRTTDIVPANLQLGQQVYLETCASCHVGLPPAIMPSQTWRSLIQEPQHYGTVISALQDPLRRVAWNYIATFSRPINQGEEVPFRIRQSRFFKALHPRVEFAEPVTINSCATCHSAAAQFDYRTLTPEWADSP
jgi:hypothetical protein